MVTIRAQVTPNLVPAIIQIGSPESTPDPPRICERILSPFILTVHPALPRVTPPLTLKWPDEVIESVD